MSAPGKQSKGRAVPNALLICNRCHEPCIALLEKWGELLPSSSKSEKNVKSKNNIKDQKITILSGENNKWVFQSHFDEYKKNAQNSFSPYFPMCNICINQFINEINQQIMYFMNQNMFLQEQISNKDVESKMKEIILKIRKTELVTQEIHFCKPQSWRINEIDEEFKQKLKVDELSKEQNTFSEIGTRIFMNFKAFNISYDKFYCTINKQRIGITTCDNISIDEVDRGLNYLGQLVFNLSRIMQITNDSIFSEFQFYPSLMIKCNDTFIQFSMKEKKEKTLQLFFNKLFELCFKLFDKIRMVFKDIYPPYIIDLKTNKIGNCNFIFNKNNPNIWNQAMKYLLFDFKLLMFYIIRDTFISSK